MSDDNFDPLARSALLRLSKFPDFSEFIKDDRVQRETPLFMDYQFRNFSGGRDREMLGHFAGDPVPKRRKLVHKARNEEPLHNPPSWLLKIPEVETKKNEIPQMATAKWTGKVPFRQALVGASGSGKTTELIFLWNEVYSHYFDEIWLWTPNFVLDDAYRSLKRQPDRVFTRFDVSQFQELIDRARNLVPEVADKNGKLNLKKLQELDFSTNDLPSVWVVLDDMVLNGNAMKAVEFHEFALLGRHINVSTTTLSQQYNKLPKPVRINQSMLCLFATENAQELDDMASEHSGGVLNPRQWKKMFNDLTSTNKWDFITIMTTAVPEERFRKGLAEIVDIAPYFDGTDAAQQQVSEKLLKRIQSSSKGSEESKDDNANVFKAPGWLGPARSAIELARISDFTRAALQTKPK